MADVKAVLAWANEVCSTALTEARAGDIGLVNRIGANSSMKLFFDNVHGIKSVKADAFPAYYPGHFKELARLYEEYMRDQEADTKTEQLNAVTESLVKLGQQLTEQAAKLAAQDVEIAALKEAKKPAKSKKDAEVAESESEE